MGGDLARRNQILYCTYHMEKGHTTKQCQVLKDHLEQLVKAGCLKELLMDKKVGLLDRVQGVEVIHFPHP